MPRGKFETESTDVVAVEAEVPEGGRGWNHPDPVIPIEALAETESPPTRELDHFVAKSRFVKTRAGVLLPGDPVTAEAVGGERTLAALVRGGSVILQ